MPSLTELVTAATDFVTTYGIFIAGGAVLGLGASALARLVKGMR